jgi:hypothetical protein
MTFFKAPLLDCPRAEPGAPPTLGQLSKKGFYAPHEAKGNHSLTGIVCQHFANPAAAQKTCPLVQVIASPITPPSDIAQRW